MLIRFLQADEILDYLAEEAISRVEFFCCNDNARPHTARQTQALLRDLFDCDIFEHPPYSPGLAPSDFFLFPKIKEHHASKLFANEEDLKNAVGGHLL